MLGKPICKLAQMILDINSLKWSNNFTYLGIDFVLGSSLYVCCKHRIRKFVASVSLVLHSKSVGYENVFAEILLRKCLPVLMYGLDAVSLDSNSIKLVTQVWNCAFRWLYGVGKFTSTRHLFDSHGTMTMRFLLHCYVLSLYAGMQFADNVLLTKLFLYQYYGKKIQDLFASYDLSKFHNVSNLALCKNEI